MIYYNNNDILIRDMVESDIQTITDEEIAQGWHQTTAKYEERFMHQKEGKCVSLVAEYKNMVAGYINVYPKIIGGPFVNTDYPEIVDFGVLEKFRCRGIGTALMDTAEDIAKKYADTVCLGVGLHAGYGSAQRMYVKRGYVPDGSGVWFNEKVCEPYSDCCNDDGLILYLSKKL